MDKGKGTLFFPLSIGRHRSGTHYPPIWTMQDASLLPTPTTPRYSLTFLLQRVVWSLHNSCLPACALLFFSLILLRIVVCPSPSPWSFCCSRGWDLVVLFTRCTTHFPWWVAFLLIPFHEWSRETSRRRQMKCHFGMIYLPIKKTINKRSTSFSFSPFYLGQPPENHEDLENVKNFPQPRPPCGPAAGREQVGWRGQGTTYAKNEDNVAEKLVHHGSNKTTIISHSFVHEDCCYVRLEPL